MINRIARFSDAGLKYVHFTDDVGVLAPERSELSTDKYFALDKFIRAVMLKCSLSTISIFAGDLDSHHASFFYGHVEVSLICLPTKSSLYAFGLQTREEQKLQFAAINVKHKMETEQTSAHLHILID